MPTKRSLITGGAGFIGSHLADALIARGDEIVILDDLSTGTGVNVQHLLDGGRAELVEGGTCDASLVDELIAGVDRCYHLASAVGVSLICDRPLETMLRNVRGCDVVTEAAARHGVRLVFTSTSEVYGKHSDGALREDADRLLGSPLKSRWAYANAKTFGELLAFAYHREQGTETVVARLFNTVGARQSGAYGMVLPRFANQALRQQELTVFGDGTQTRCFAHVADTVDAIVRLADCDEAVGGVFNIGSSQEISILELAQRVIERAESVSSIRFVPYEEAYGEGFEELGRRKPDTTALERMTGWGSRHGIEEMIDDVLAYQRALIHANGLHVS